MIFVVGCLCSKHPQENCLVTFSSFDWFTLLFSYFPMCYMLIMNTQGFPGALKRSIKPVGHISKVRTHTLYSLQMTMLGGSMSVNGGLAYVAQQAWILNDSLRENILFGKEYIEEKYELYLQMTL